MDSRLKCNDRFKLRECLGGCLEVQAFTWRIVEALYVPPEIGGGKEIEVGLVRQRSSQASD